MVPGGALAVSGFLVVWLSLWTLGGVMAIREWLRLMWSEDRILVTSEALCIRRRLGPFHSTTRIARPDLKGIHTKPRRSRLLAETSEGIVEITALADRSECEALERELRETLGLVETPPAGAVPERPPEGWTEVVDPDGWPAVTQDPAIRKAQARTAWLFAMLLAIPTFLLFCRILDHPEWGALAAMLGAATGLSAWGAWRLTTTRFEWRLDASRVSLRRRSASGAIDLFEGASVELVERSDSDGDSWFTLNAVSADGGKRKKIAQAMDDPSVPRRLGAWISDRAPIPFDDRATEQRKKADLTLTLAQLEASGRLGRWLAQKLKASYGGGSAAELEDLLRRIEPLPEAAPRPARSTSPRRTAAPRRARPRTETPRRSTGSRASHWTRSRRPDEQRRWESAPAGAPARGRRKRACADRTPPRPDCDPRCAPSTPGRTGSRGSEGPKRGRTRRPPSAGSSRRAAPSPARCRPPGTLRFAAARRAPIGWPVSASRRRLPNRLVRTTPAPKVEAAKLTSAGESTSASTNRCADTGHVRTSSMCASSVRRSLFHVMPPTQRQDDHRDQRRTPPARRRSRRGSRRTAGSTAIATSSAEPTQADRGSTGHATRASRSSTRRATSGGPRRSSSNGRFDRAREEIFAKRRVGDFLASCASSRARARSPRIAPSSAARSRVARGSTSSIGTAATTNAVPPPANIGAVSHQAGSQQRDEQRRPLERGQTRGDLPRSPSRASAAPTCVRNGTSASEQRGVEAEQADRQHAAAACARGRPESRSDAG